MRHLLVDIPEDDQRHLVEVVDRNHADQLRRKRESRPVPDAETVPEDVEDGYDIDDAHGDHVYPR